MKLYLLVPPLKSLIDLKYCLSHLKHIQNKVYMHCYFIVYYNSFKLLVSHYTCPHHQIVKSSGPHVRTAISTLVFMRSLLMKQL